MTKYLIVGAGLFGATFAYEAAKKGHKVKVIERRNHIAGNIFTKEVDGIQVHQYGAHIFHTSILSRRKQKNCSKQTIHIHFRWTKISATSF